MTVEEINKKIQERGISVEEAPKGGKKSARRKFYRIKRESSSYKQSC